MKKTYEEKIYEWKNFNEKIGMKKTYEWRKNIWMKKF